MNTVPAMLDAVGSVGSDRQLIAFLVAAVVAAMGVLAYIAVSIARHVGRP